jgi:hypothetical protein
LLDEIERVAGENIGDVAARRCTAPVDVEVGIVARTLAAEAHPTVKAGTRGIIISHVPLPHEGRLVACIVQQPRPCDQPVAQCIARNIVFDSASV